MLESDSTSTDKTPTFIMIVEQSLDENAGLNCPFMHVCEWQHLLCVVMDTTASRAMTRQQGQEKDDSENCNGVQGNNFSERSPSRTSSAGRDCYTDDLAGAGFVQAAQV